MRNLGITLNRYLKLPLGRKKDYFENRIVNHYEIITNGNTTPTDFLNYIREAEITFVTVNRQNKVSLNLICEMIKLDPATGRVIEEDLASFNSGRESVFETTDLESLYDKMIGKILESFAAYLKNGSGWAIKWVVRAEIILSKLKPLRGSSYMELPKKIKDRKAIINMKNKDDRCIVYSITRAINPTDNHPERITKELKKQSEELNFEGIEFPTSCSERTFKKIEKNNPTISLSVFGHEYVRKPLSELSDINIIPLYVSKERREKTARLFFWKNKDGTKSHYGVVESMSRLVGSQISKKKAKKICL